MATDQVEPPKWNWFWGKDLIFFVTPPWNELASLPLKINGIWMIWGWHMSFKMACFFHGFLLFVTGRLPGCWTLDLCRRWRPWKLPMPPIRNWFYRRFWISDLAKKVTLSSREYIDSNHRFSGDIHRSKVARIVFEKEQLYTDNLTVLYGFCWRCIQQDIVC